MLTVQLKKNEDRRLRAGHLWIYSNEIDITETPIKGVEAGTLCRFADNARQDSRHRLHQPDRAAVRPPADRQGRRDDRPQLVLSAGCNRR
jgi:hypothetical protein